MAALTARTASMRHLSLPQLLQSKPALAAASAMRVSREDNSGSVCCILTIKSKTHGGSASTVTRV